MADREPFAPVTFTPGDEDSPPEEGIGRCLSGGGFRAMLFHLGTRWRLNQLGYLPRLARVSSVSGGSITAGVLGLAWRGLAWAGGVAGDFAERVAAPLHAVADRGVDRAAFLRGVFRSGPASRYLVEAYREHLFGEATLQDLPADADGPRFVLNATNLQSTSLWRFSRPYAADWRVGRIDLDPDAFVPGSGASHQTPPYTEHALLADGGIYDNLGLETAWKRYHTVLVSNGVGRTEPAGQVHTNWLRLLRRVYDLTDHQVRSMRARQVVGSLALPSEDPGHRDGAYWGIRTAIARYGLDDALPCPPSQTEVLADTPTRLAKKDGLLQRGLVNWGYAVCDAGVRRALLNGRLALSDAPITTPAFPYPDAGVG